jgi:hypothetical protein
VSGRPPGTLPGVPPPPPPRLVTLVLCTPDGAVLGQLPPFRAEPVWWPDAAGVVAGARERYGVDVTVLRLLETELPAQPGGAVTVLAEVDGPGGLPLAPYAGELPDHPLRLPYARPGGPARDLAWARARLEEAGQRPGGRPEQVRTWNLSSLWRLPLEDGAAWLKCVPPFFAHEGAVLERLAGGPVPRLLAHEPGRVLLAEIPGEDQYDAPLPVLLALVPLLVGLQVGEVGREDELLALGLPDWRGRALSEAVADVVHRHAHELDAEVRRGLDGLLAGLDRRWADLAACGLPDTLVHGDFHPGNARGDGSHLVLMDWGDCGVGHPLLDQPAMLDRIAPGNAEAVRSAWERAWQQAVPGSDPRRAAALVAPLAAARQAVIYQRFLDGIEPSEHPYHRDDPVLWLGTAAVAARW